LETSVRREAEERKHQAAAQITQQVDAALMRAGLRPLNSWTANWMDRAVELRRAIQDHGDDVIGETRDALSDDPIPEYARDLMVDGVDSDYEIIRRREGYDAAERFRSIALGSGLSVAEAARRWLIVEETKVKAGTIHSHKAALKLFGAYLDRTEGWKTLEAVSLSAVTRRIAGDFLQERRAAKAHETVMRDFSAFSGLWRWAVRRGHAEANPWLDQTAGMSRRRTHDKPEAKRGYSSQELVKLLNATNELAPSRGGYAAAFWDIIRLLLLTGARASELLDLRLTDVVADGAAIAISAEGGKTESASRIVPLHPFAQAVLKTRVGLLPDNTPATSSLWPEIPPTGKDKRRAKIISTRYPDIRRRVLGESEAVDLHSFRRSFMTAAETAMHMDGAVNESLLSLLVGHKRNALAFDLYSDWARMGRQEFKGQLQSRLETLQKAVTDIVDLGFDETVKEALEGTKGNRPAQVRLEPAFTRKPR